MNLGNIPSRIRQFVQQGINFKLIHAYKKVFKSEEGQLVLQDLAMRFKLADICKDQLDEGGRRCVLHITAMLQLDPRDFSNLYEQGE
jgi:hypothetical protein